MELKKGWKVENLLEDMKLFGIAAKKVNEEIFEDLYKREKSLRRNSMELKKGNYLEDKYGDSYVVTDVEKTFGEIVRIKDGERFCCGVISHNMFLDILGIKKVYEDSNLEKVIWRRLEEKDE